MPAGVLPDEGIGAQLGYILSATITGVVDWQLILFTNDITVDASTVYADLTEATWAGYTRRTLARAMWTAPTVSDGCATSTYTTSPQVYSVGTVDPDTINYGAAYYDPGGGVLRWCQRFDDADLNALTTGGQFQILPTYTLTSAACEAMMSAARPTARRKRKGK